MKTILLIEYDQQQARRLQQSLQARRYVVKHAPSIEQARAQLDNQTPDLIVMAVSLPDGSGYDFTRSLRQQAATQTIPVVLYLSADSEQAFNAQKNWGLHLGASEVLKKPVEPLQLLASLNRLCYPVQSPAKQVELSPSRESASAAEDDTATAEELDPALLQNAEQVLARHLGPIAKVLVQQAALSAVDQAEFRQLLIQHIADAAQQKLVLAQLQSTA